MKIKIFRRKFTMIFCIGFLTGISVLSADAQTAPAKPASQTVNQATANEDFELNIVQERITETNFARSTSVELSNNNRGGLRVEVGVGVRAEQVDILLRGIYGRVRFRASLESLRQRIEQLQTLTTQNSIAPVQ
jgi:hypothetical protein